MEPPDTKVGPAAPRIAELKERLARADAQIEVLRGEAFAAVRAAEADLAELDRLRAKVGERKEEARIWRQRAKDRAQQIAELKRQLKRLRWLARVPLVLRLFWLVKRLLKKKPAAPAANEAAASPPTRDAEGEEAPATPQVLPGSIIPTRQRWRLEPVAFVLLGQDADGVAAWLEQVRAMQLVLASFKPLFIVTSDAAAPLEGSGYTFETVMPSEEWRRVSDDHGWAAFASQRVKEILDEYQVRYRVIGASTADARALATAIMITAPVTS